MKVLPYDKFPFIILSNCIFQDMFMSPYLEFLFLFETCNFLLILNTRPILVSHRLTPSHTAYVTIKQEVISNNFFKYKFYIAI